MDQANNIDSDILLVSPPEITDKECDLVLIQQTFRSKPTYTPKEVETYEIRYTVKNSGPNRSGKFNLRVSLPNGINFHGVQQRSVSIRGSTAICKFKSLAPHDSVHVLLKVNLKADEPGKLITNSTVTGITKDTNLVNNIVTDTLTVTPITSMSLNKEQRMKNFTKQFIMVEGGIFKLGDLSGRGSDDERPAHRVKLDRFKISMYEITNQQYCDFLNSYEASKADVEKLVDLSSRYCQIKERAGQFIVVDESKQEHPVVTVSWYGAILFCNFMSELFGYSPCYNLNDWSCDFNAKGFRLPTEAEWEYACRAGSTTSFNTGDKLTFEQANFYGNYSTSKYIGNTTPVGRYPTNALGIYDMHGNVYEWCQDWYKSKYYNDCEQQDIIENPFGPNEGSNRVFRGGSWYYNAQFCRSAHRNRFEPHVRNFLIGFRTVLVP